ncbi:MAG TPA: AGE family epimerase/isomerase [Spirochaetia bacterium]|nr:AGE family epimerase/isomerase [Spirochaetia bacterium]
MDEKKRLEYLRRYESALNEDVIPFWLRHSLDKEAGGYFTCLDRDGSVYDTDKFLWLQGREAWMFSALYNRRHADPGLLDAAALGIDFLKSHGRDDDGNWYFALDRRGNPVSEAWSIFADCFVAMAFSQYALAANDDSSRAIAVATYENIWKRKAAPAGRFSTEAEGVRPMIGFSLPMILVNLCLEFEGVLPSDRLIRDGRQGVREIMGLFLDRESMLLHESVAPDGGLVDCFEGRRINPGHGVEVMWFVMSFASKLGDESTLRLAVETALRQLEHGWDTEHGGLYAFMDSRGFPPEQLEWDQKLWWAHLESIVTMLMGYRLTGDERCWEWFQRLDAYTWSKFPDPEYGEWFGYLNRRGEVSLRLKGGKWKGCFHVPRGLWMAADELRRLSV